MTCSIAISRVLNITNITSLVNSHVCLTELILYSRFELNRIFHSTTILLMRNTFGPVNVEIDMGVLTNTVLAVPWGKNLVLLLVRILNLHRTEASCIQIKVEQYRLKLMLNRCVGRSWSLNFTGQYEPDFKLIPWYLHLLKISLRKHYKLHAINKNSL